MTTTTDAPPVERTPGIYADVPAEDYHAGPGISASGLKRLLPPYTPAHYKYGEPYESAALDFGKVAHRLVLGEGDAFVVSPFDSFRSNDAKAWKAEQDAAGNVVITAADLEKARAMAEAVKAHPLAGQLFTDGAPEVSLYWTDAETGVLCRARYDWMRNLHKGRRLLIPDLKTARSAEPWSFAKAAADYGYAISAEFYRQAAIANGLDPDPLPLFVAVEKAAPYLVSVTAISDEDMEMARGLIRRGLRIYADCLARDEWPGYPETVIDIELPTYHRIKTEDYLNDHQ